MEHNNSNVEISNNNNNNNNNNHDDHHHPTPTSNMTDFETGLGSATVGYGFGVGVGVGTGVGLTHSPQYRSDTGLTRTSNAQRPGLGPGIESDGKFRETLSRRGMWEGLQRVVRLHLSPKQVRMMMLTSGCSPWKISLWWLCFFLYQTIEWHYRIYFVP